MKHITSKLLSLLLTLAMLLSMIPAAYAEGTEGTTEGSTSTEKVVAKDGETTATTETLDGSTTVTGSNAATADDKGTSTNPYTLEQLGVMTRNEYIKAQERLEGTMYVTVGEYSYDTNGTLGNGKRDDTTGQKEDRGVLNGYNSNGYLDEGNDGANGKNIVFVGGTITSNVTGYESIDNIGTSLLLAVPAYTNVTFKGTTFNNVMSFNYQLYTGPWSQLGELKFDGCTFNGIIVGAIAAQTLTFNGCTFNNYENTDSANNSNPTWIRPAYGNWKKDDNEGQGGDFRSLTEINFTDNTVTSTRPVKSLSTFRSGTSRALLLRPATHLISQHSLAIPASRMLVCISALTRIKTSSILWRITTPSRKAPPRSTRFPKEQHPCPPARR